MNLLTKCSGALARCFGAVSFLRRFAEITAQHPAGIFDAALCLNPADLTLPQLLASQPTLRRVVGYHILPNVPVLDAFWTTPFMLPNTVLSTLLVTMPSFSLSRSLPFSACSHAAATSIQSIARKLLKPAGRQKTQLPCRQNTTLKHSGSCRFCRVRLRQSRKFDGDLIASDHLRRHQPEISTVHVSPGVTQSFLKAYIMQARFRLPFLQALYQPMGCNWALKTISCAALLFCDVTQPVDLLSL